MDNDMRESVPGASIVMPRRSPSGFAGVKGHPYRAGI